jgi:branched-chain amino acid transport system permease protein
MRHEPMSAVQRRASRARCALAPWVAMVAIFAAPLALRAEYRGLLGYLAQTAAMIVLALSYNLLLGETGLLSFGHAAYSGLAAFVAAQAFNRYGIALPCLPLVGGIAGAALAVPFGFIATRRSGTAFAMITLGIGELALAVVWAAPAGFGDAAGVVIDRAAGPAWGHWTFGPAREAYAVVATWCMLACAAMAALARTPFARLANAVRDNERRVSALGTDPRRVRYAMLIVSAFFAGVAGTLTLIDIEVASSEGLSMARSGDVLIATVMGGSASFFGPVLGAAVLTGFSVGLASVTRAWPFYLGLIFVAIVMRAPNGIVGIVGHGLRAIRRLGALGRSERLAMVRAAFSRAVAWLAALAACVLAVETLYARQFAVDAAGQWHFGAYRFDAAAPMTWVVVAALACVAAIAALHARRARTSGHGPALHRGARS